jgi:hypothetical protein
LLGAGGIDGGEGVLAAEAVRAWEFVGLVGHNRWSKHISKRRRPANLTLWAPLGAWHILQALFFPSPGTPGEGQGGGFPRSIDVRPPPRPSP